MSDATGPTGITWLLVGAGIATFSSLIVGVCLDLWKRWKDGKGHEHRQEEELKSGLNYILEELEAAKKKPPFAEPEQPVEAWSLLPDSGLELLELGHWASHIPNELLRSLLRAYGSIREINFHMHAQLLNRGTPSPKQDAQNAMRNLRESCEKAIDECILEIKDKLAKMEPTARKST